MNTGRTIKLTAIFITAFIFTIPAGHTHEDASSTAVLKRLDALEQRIGALEAARSFAAFMPDLAERFHVMHRAGEAGDWAVAGHELAEMQRLARQSLSINPEKGALMQTMLAPSFEKLESAIGHGNEKKFSIALENTISACNSCHVATGAEFVQVTLDASDGLSMRHPHRLMIRDAPEGHHHGSQGGQMMPGGHGGSAAAHEHAPGPPAVHGHDAPEHGGMMQQ